MTISEIATALDKRETTIEYWKAKCSLEKPSLEQMRFIRDNLAKGKWFTWIKANMKK